jgi:hypothetical protein
MPDIIVTANTNTALSLNFIIAIIPLITATNAKTPARTIGIDTSGLTEKSAISVSLAVTSVYIVFAEIVEVIKLTTTSVKANTGIQLSFDLNLKISLES